MVHRRTLQALEFDKIINHFAQFCCSPSGKEKAALLVPFANSADITHALQLYEEFCVWLESAGGREFTFKDFPDLSTLLANISNPRFLIDTEGFWALRCMLLLARTALTSICTQEASVQWPSLLALTKIADLPFKVVTALERCISDDALIVDESSPELLQIRTEIRELHQRCIRRVRDFAVQYNILHYLQEEFITLSSDRYVLPLKAAYRDRLQGILHDWSQTGETCYFEPMFLVDLNNHLQELKQRERKEEQKILQYLRDLVINDLAGVKACLQLLTEMDVLYAKKHLADAFHGRAVTLSSSAEGFALFQARHPLLSLGSEAVHPLDIMLRPAERSLIITGGNAGGKTVCLKTLGLIVVMTASGLPVPVDKGSHLPHFDRVEAFIGDGQSLEDHLSTFTAQIEHFAEAWESLSSKSLVLLDEFGAGTDPAQGSALALALFDSLLDKQVFVVAATHFPALKTWALTHQQARAASMLFDPATKKPLFALAYDQVGASLALATAEEHGLPLSIIRRAEAYLQQGGIDENASLERLNKLAVQREEELRKLRILREKARQAILRNNERTKKVRETLYAEVRQKAADLMHAWQEGRATAKQALHEMSALRATLIEQEKRQNEHKLPTLPKIGERVFHTVLHKQGLVTDVDAKRGRFRLDLGGVSIWAELNDLGISKETVQVKTEHQVGMPTIHSEDNPALRLDVRGYTAEAAVTEVARFLDRALLAGFSSVEIIHGRGTGALRREIHTFLKSLSAVESFTLASEEYGGDGLTSVLLR